MEFELINWLRKRLPQGECVTLPPGDDAAGLQFSSNDCLVTTDLLLDGVHFRTEEHTPQQIGHKLLAVNLSDIAAMAGTPRAAFISIVMPQSNSQIHSFKQFAMDLYEGMIPLAERYQVSIAGGDTNSWQGPFAVNLTLLGEPHAMGFLKRSGATAKDRILVTGELGGSILGHHLNFEPRIHEAQQLFSEYEIHAGLDISDGLTKDLMHLVEESFPGSDAPLGAILDWHHIPISNAAKELSKSSGKLAIEHALGDGEDFELLLAVPPDEATRLIADQPLNCKITDIGEFTDQQEFQSRLWQRGENKQPTPLKSQGFEHRFSGE